MAPPVLYLALPPWPITGHVNACQQNHVPTQIKATIAENIHQKNQLPVKIGCFLCAQEPGIWMKEEWKKTSNATLQASHTLMAPKPYLGSNFIKWYKIALLLQANVLCRTMKLQHKKTAQKLDTLAALCARLNQIMHNTGQSKNISTTCSKKNTAMGA